MISIDESRVGAPRRASSLQFYPFCLEHLAKLNVGAPGGSVSPYRESRIRLWIISLCSFVPEAWLFLQWYYTRNCFKTDIKVSLDIILRQCREVKNRFFYCRQDEDNIFESPLSIEFFTISNLYFCRYLKYIHSSCSHSPWMTLPVKSKLSLKFLKITFCLS